MTAPAMAESSTIGSSTYWSLDDVATDETERSSAFSEDYLPLTATITLCIQPELREATWLDELLDDLREVVGLRANWNGCGERSIHAASVKRVVEIINKLSPTVPRPSVVPLSSGALQLEWHGPALSVEVEVPPEGPALGNVYSDVSDLDEEWQVAGQPNDSRGVAELDRLLAQLAA